MREKFKDNVNLFVLKVTVNLIFDLNINRSCLSVITNLSTKVRGL